MTIQYNWSMLTLAIDIVCFFEEITENNIDKEIENVGRRWGMDIEKQYNTMSWIHLAMNGAICKVYIP